MSGPSIDLADETFVVADRGFVARKFDDPELWRTWWPRLRLTVFMNRGLDGVRWSVTGELTGSAEIWLEAWGDGVIVHWFLRAELGSGFGPAEAARVQRRYATSFKRRIHAVKDEMEKGRVAGVPRLDVER